MSDVLQRLIAILGIGEINHLSTLMVYTIAGRATCKNRKESHVQYNQMDERWHGMVATEVVAPNPTISETFDVAKTYTEDVKRTGVISVLLIDDHALMREGLRRLLELEEDIRIVGEAEDGLDALHKIRQLSPQVALMDISLPIMDGIAVTQQVTHQFPATAVIMLTMYRQNHQVLQAMKSGARGYLLKSISSHELAQAIRTVHEGGMLIEPDLTGAIVSEFRRLSNSVVGGHASHSLSEKEIEIIRYVATGMSNKEIAEKLSYSEKTVKNYLSIIFQKLGTRDRTQAAIFALRNGLLSHDEEEL
jgi:DNA-binding NarL/FixJ family response regulator